MNSYLIELRAGYTRYKLVEKIDHVANKFNLDKECHRVPHLSLYGSFTIKNGYYLKDLKRIIEKTACKYNKLSYFINGWDYHTTDNGGVIGFKIEPSPEFRKFREELIPNLWPITTPKHSYDFHPENAWYHITLAYRLGDHQYNSILQYLGEQEPGFIKSIFNLIRSSTGLQNNKELTPSYLPVDALRISIIHNSFIAAEYDLTSKRWLGRLDAKSSIQYGYTLQNYRRQQGIELTGPNYLNDPSIFTIADTHIRHKNIIDYCSRPFNSTNVKEMDQVLIKNWNYTVKPNDYVFFVGDLCMDRDPKGPDRVLQYLNGQITFIKGNHDENISKKILNSIYHYHGVDFLFLHNPNDVPDAFNGWVIHGHTHNNNLRKYPFFDPQKKRVNVGVELIKYQPIRLKKIYDLITGKSGQILNL